MDIVEPNLIDEVDNIHPDERYSFIFRDSFNQGGSRGSAQILDHAMTSQALAPMISGFEFARGNADAAEELVEDDGTLDELALRASDSQAGLSIDTPTQMTMVYSIPAR